MVLWIRIILPKKIHLDITGLKDKDKWKTCYKQLTYYILSRYSLSVEEVFNKDNLIPTYVNLTLLLQVIITWDNLNVLNFHLKCKKII